MAPSSQMAVASSTSGMALASSVLRTASALDFWTYAAWTPTSSPLPLLQLSSMCPSVARGTRTDSELGSRASTSTSPNSGSGLTCVPSLLKSRCGEWDTQNQTEPRPHQDRYVQNLDIHPEFNPRNLANDWAVLYTAQNFDLQAHIDTVCLPQPEELFDFQTCFATGWGKDEFGAAGNYQVVLKEIDLPVVGHDQCEASLRTTRLGKRFQLDDSFICAGGVDGKDTCKGDGGSPLVCQSKFDPTSYVQAGIVAWGIGCGEDNTPGVYASVSKGVCWIDYAMTCQFGQRTGSYSSYWGYSAQQCQTWMNGELNRLSQEVTDMQNAGNLTGRKKAATLAKGIKAQETLNKYAQCNVLWQPIDAAPLTTGGNGYVDGGNVDISDFERVGPSVAQTSDSSAVKLTQGSTY